MAAPVPSAARGPRLQELKPILALSAGGLLFGGVAGELIASGHSAGVLSLAVVLLPVALWKRPQLGPVVLLVAALLIEQVGQATATADMNAPGVGAVVLTAHIPLTSQIPLFRGIGSLHLQPADLFLLTIFTIYLVKTSGTVRWWPHSQLSASVYFLLGAVAVGIVVGLMHHGSLRVALMETRPFVYLASAYVLTAVLVQNRRAIRTMLWAFVAVTGLKAVQAIYIFWSVRNMNPHPEALLGHEEALFFGVFILLVPALWLFDVRGPLRKVSTFLLPLVIAANLANNRRTAWVVLGVGLLLLVIISMCYLPGRRRILRRALLATLAISAVYFPAYWNKSGGLAQPARAVHSIVTPDHRDAASDLYRVQENANLKLNIKEGGVLGRGFGVPIDYALPIVDIKSIDPLIAYVPHNGVYYVLMRMGLLGGLAFWGLLAAGIIASCRLAKSMDAELGVVGAIVACTLLAYAFEGALDQGFFFYRIAFVVGALLGLVEAGHRIRRRDELLASATRAGRRRIKFVSHIRVVRA